jgi:hypothetical protein
MARKFALALSIFTTILLASAVVLYAHSEPSTAALDADLAEVQAQLKAVDEEDAKLAGGLIKVMVGLQREVLRTSHAMLMQKRAALIRRIDLRYTVDGSRLAPVSEEKLSEIAVDLEKAESELAKSEEQATRYSGGLMQVMALVTVETNRLSLAQARLACYAAKYGFALPAGQRVVGNAADRGSPGTVVEDMDAL